MSDDLWREYKRDYHREYDRKRKEAQTPEEREARLASMREYYYKRRSARQDPIKNEGDD